MSFALIVVDIVILEGELSDLVEEFSDGKIQFAFVKVKDSNSSLPKNVLIAWVRYIALIFANRGMLKLYC